MRRWYWNIKGRECFANLIRAPHVCGAFFLPFPRYKYELDCDEQRSSPQCDDGTGILIGRECFAIFIVEPRMYAGLFFAIFPL
jgi:hypothetical protein